MPTRRYPMPSNGVYLITPERCADRLAQIRAAASAGASLLQYRNKTGDSRRRLAEAQSLQIICREFRIPLIINDDIELAYAIGAAGVHLGKDDADVSAARTRLGDAAIIGVSCYDSIERAQTLAQRGANYLAFGSFFPSPTKPDAAAANTRLLTQAKAFGLPIVAIGGIRPDNGRGLIAAGADFLAVISGVFEAADPTQAMNEYVKLFTYPHKSSRHEKP